ncbi:MAG: signal recognition particle-docking protein FtsY [Oscillospiraceae bacterium]|nr:signal recognition particle-docking protein FtsY [Oscillospiraceae bacterium]MBR5045840.1 signal recognition particle-docking protein FtsY [Oscillospiraceae bacterium]MBR5071874.1 signal recognition particle-docking protein FtsY [Oscillospiraceae bacterium]
MGLFDKLKAGLTKTKNNFAYSVRADKISDEYFERVEEAMILSDAGYDVAMSVSEELRKAVRDNNAADEEAANVLLRKICSDRLRADRELDLSGDPAVIMLIGVNGSGKTTAAGKLAAYYKQQGRKVMIAAADTFRAAAAEQLEVWAQRSGTEFFSGQNDPSAVVFDAVRSAAAGRADLVICDTAGRLQTKKNLMDELGKIARTVRKAAPDASVETLLVLDGMTGQNAIEQARAFAETADVSGIIVTKLDGTAKGGSVFSVKEKLGIPVRFVGVGEGIDDLLVFDPDEFCEALFE